MKREAGEEKEGDLFLSMCLLYFRVMSDPEWKMFSVMSKKEGMGMAANYELIYFECC